MDNCVVAGHGNTLSIGRLVVKKMNPTEISFYKKLDMLRLNSPDLNEIFPRTYKYLPNDMVLISRVGRSLDKPSYCDVKIGFRTFSNEEFIRNRRVTAKFGKRIKMMSLDLIKGSIKNGYRVEGFTKEMKTIRKCESKSQLVQFFVNNKSAYTQAINHLKNIERIMSSKDFTFVGSSVLFAISDDKSQIESKLIDFEHPFFFKQDPKIFYRLKKNFIDGIKQLIIDIKYFQKIASYTEPSLAPRLNNHMIENLCLSPKCKSQWDYSSRDFDLKLTQEGKADINYQNISSAKLWYNTLFTDLDKESFLYNKSSDIRLEEQKDILLRNICALAISEPLIGNQDINVYFEDNKHSIAELISCGGRFGFIFKDKKIGINFFNYLLFGNKGLNSKKYEDVISDLSIDYNKNYANLYKRFSTHSQKLNSEGNFVEEKIYAKPVKGAIGMDFPMGGIGNHILSEDYSNLIGYQGKLPSSNYQVGSMLLKYDESSNKSRLMCGFESCAPYHKSLFGQSHKTNSILRNTLRSLSIKKMNSLRGLKNSYKKAGKARSLTGQYKGPHHGIFYAYGSNIAIIDKDKLELFKKLYTGLSNMDINTKKLYVRELLVSRSRNKRNSIINKILESKKNNFLENHLKYPKKTHGENINSHQVDNCSCGISPKTNIGPSLNLS